MDQMLPTSKSRRLHVRFAGGRVPGLGALIIHGRGDTLDGQVPRLLQRTCQGLGLATLLVDLPGHGKSYGPFADFVYTQTVHDLEAAVAWLHQQGIVLVTVLGHSLGASLAISLAARSKAVGTVIALAPPQHLRERFLSKYAPLQLQQLARRGFAEYVRTKGHVGRQNKAFFDDLPNVDLLRDAKQIRVPTLVLHGTADDLHTLAEEREFVAAIGGEHKALKILRGCGHDFLPPHRERARRLMVQYLRRFFCPSFSPVVNAFVQRSDGRLLFVRRSARLFYYGGYWHVVAGFLDKQRSPQRQALVELREELGLRSGQVRFVRAARPFFRNDPEHARRWKIHPVLFRLSGRTPRVRLNWESERAAWLTPQQFLRRQTVPNICQSFHALGLV